MTDKWYLGHFASGVIAQNVLKDSDKALLGHLIWEVYEKTGRFQIIRKFLPLWIRQLFELEGYENGDSLENLVGDFYYFYLGVLVYKLFYSKT